MKCHPWLVSSPSLYAPFWKSLDFSLLTCYAQCCHGDGSGVRHVHKYHSHSLYYQATFGIVIGHLAFIVAMVMVVMVVIGDTCVQSHTHYYQATMLVIVIVAWEAIR